MVLICSKSTIALIAAVPINETSHNITLISTISHLKYSSRLLRKTQNDATNTTFQ